MGTMGFVLVIACTNVTNLFLVRMEHRRREIAVRTALGAGRRQLSSLFLSESVLLALAGGLLGLLVAYASVAGFVSSGLEDIPRLEQVRIDGWVLAFATMVSMLTCLLLAGVALARCSRPNLVSALKDGARGSIPSRGQHRFGGLLIASQLALALTLLIGSALMVQTFLQIRDVDPGFDADGVLTLQLALPFRAYSSYEDVESFYRQLLDHVRTLPGVEAAGAVSSLPLRGIAFTDMSYSLEVESQPRQAETVTPMVTLKLVTPGYFDAMGIPVLEGQRLRPGDGTQGSLPVFVNSALARTFFPNGNAIGQRIRRSGKSDRPWATIAGLVDSVRNEAVTGDETSIFYLPVLDKIADTAFAPRTMTLAIRTSLPPFSLTPAIRRIIREMDPKLPLSDVQTMSQIVASRAARTSFTMLLLLTAAAASLFLGAVGIYSVISFTVARRSQEIGIRMALGARTAEVCGMVLRRGVTAAIGGLVVGVLAALALTRFLRHLLFEVSPTDPMTFATMSILLLLIAVAATYLPARRAARVDPVKVLNEE